MPPKASTKPSVKCVKFGEILMDENRRLCFLCTHCSLDFQELQAYRQHLKNCNRVQHLFKGQGSSKLNCVNGTKLLKKVMNKSKELILYGFAENHTTDLLSIEQELLDPRWYTDTAVQNEIKTKKQSSYNDLIEEVTPFVHFKENVKSNVTTRATSVSIKEDAENIKKTTESSTSPSAKLYLSCDKKHILRRTVASDPNKSKITTSNTKTSKAEELDKRISRTVTKAAAATIDKEEKEEERIRQLNVEKGPLKRKTRSTPLSKVQNNDESEQAIKKRRTVGQQLQISTQPQSIPLVKQKTKEPNTKSVALSKSTNIVHTAVLPSQNTVFVSKNENKVELDTKRPSPRKGQSEILNNKQLPSQTQVRLQPQKQKQTQITLTSAKLDPLQKMVNKNQPLLENKAKTIIKTKEEPQENIRKVAHPMPAAALNPLPIISTVISLPAQEKTTANNNNKKTEEILYKLQTLGLKVQRTNPIPEPKSSCAASNSSKQALEIIKKLQSKGMNVKIVQKPNSATTKVTTQPFTTIHIPISSVSSNSESYFSTTANRNDSVSYRIPASEQSSFRNNILIKKCS